MHLIAPDPVAFTIGNLDVRWYGVIIAFGVLLGVLIACYRSGRHGITQDDILDIFLIALPVAVVGLRAYYVAFHWSEYAGDWSRIVNIREGGLAIHGGLIFGITAGWLVCRHKKISLLNVLDLCAPAIALGQAIGRWGNFCNEEAHGCETDWPISVLIDGVNYHATFLYESVWCFILFFILSFVDRHREFTGQVFCLYAMLYSVERFFVEYLRTDSLIAFRIGETEIKQAMLISVAIFIAGLFGYIYLRRKEKNEGKIFSRG